MNSIYNTKEFVLSEKNICELFKLSNEHGIIKESMKLLSEKASLPDALIHALRELAVDNIILRERLLGKYPIKRQ